MANLTDFAEFIDELAARTMRGGSVTREEILYMLAPSPDSQEAAILGKRAREMAAEITGNRGRIWTAVGIDNRPCPMNCGFCAFGEKWGLITENSEWSDEEILAAARTCASGGSSWFVLRTTQFYSFERLVALAIKVRAQVSEDCKLVVNTGEFGHDGAQKLLDAGVSSVYHTLRLGEGKSTSFNPADRLATLAAVLESALELTYLVEPLGPEHSNEEIADCLLVAREHEAVLCGVMARVNVPGTPFENHSTVSEARKSQIVAASRICGGSLTPDICVHPPESRSLDCGANVVIVEAGSIPRSNQTEHKTTWKEFGLPEAKTLLAKAGYEI